MSNNYLLQQKELVKKLEDSFIDGEHKSTVVDMRKDYVNDDRICLTSVTFIPNDISSKIISNVINNLKKIEPYHYFYPFESMHLTIKNIRTISKPLLFAESDIIKVDQLFSEIIPKFSIFEVKVEDVLILPSSVSIMVYSDGLQNLNLALDKGLREIGVPDNKKYLSDLVYWGNITICRFTEKPGNEFNNEVKKMRNFKIGKFKVEKVNLITCNAVCYSGSRKIIGGYELIK